MRRFLPWLLLMVTLLGLVGAGLAVTSEAALRWLVTNAGRWLPGTLSTQNIHGNLLGPISIEGLRYQTPESLIAIERTSLTWRPFDLLDGQLHIDHFTVDGINILLTKGSEATTATGASHPTKISVPIAIRLDSASVHRIHLQLADGTKQDIDRVSLAARINRKTLTIDTLEVAAPQGSLTVAGEIDPRDLTLDIHMAWQLQLTGFKPLEGSGTIRGNDDALRLEQTLNAPVQAQLKATLHDLWQQPTWIARLDAQTLNPQRLRDDWPTLSLDASLEGRGDFSTAWEIERLSLALPEQGARAEARGRLSRKENSLDYSLDGHWENLGWPLQGSPSYKSRNGKFQLAGRGADYRLAVEGDVESPDFPPSRLAVEGHGNEEGVDVEKLHLYARNSGENAPNVEGHGRISFKESNIDYTFDGGWKNLAWPMLTSPQYKSLAGQFQLSGRGVQYHVTLKGDVEALDFPASQLALEGQGSLESFHIDQLLLHTMDGELSGRGNVSWQPALHWQANLAARSINPGIYWPQWPGKLDATLTTTGALGDAGLDTLLDVHSVRGTLRGYPVDGNANLEIHGDHYRINELLWRAPDAELKARGELGERWQLNWSAHASDLVTLWPDLHGRLSASGTLSGDRQTPRLELQLTADQVQTKTLGVGHIQGKIDADLSERHPLLIDLDMRDAHLGEQALDKGHMHVSGNLASQHWLFDVSHGEQRLHLGLQGGYAAPSWQGALTEAEWVAGGAGTWSLEQPSTVLISADAVTAANTCLRAGEARICAGGNWKSAGDSEIQVDLHTLPSSLAATLLPQGWQWQDALSGHLTARIQEDLSLLLDGGLTLGPGKLTYAVKDRDPIGLEYERAELGVHTDARGTQLDFTSQLGGKDRVQATILLPEYHTLAPPVREQSISGRLTGNYHDLDLLSVFVPSLMEPRGALQWDVRLAGTLETPRVSGSGSLTKGEAALPELGIELSEVNVNITASDSQRLRWDGSARSGRGTVSLNGEWLLDADAGWPLHATIKGADVEIVRRPGLWIVASPDLSADTQDKQLTLRGTLGIPRANIEMKSLPETAVTPSEDVVIVRQTDETSAAQAQEGWRVITEIRLLPGEQVNFEGFGLSCRVKGDLLLNRSPGKSLLGTGSLNIVNGQYLAFGIDLNIEQGQLVFANSPIDNPAIDIRAVRVSEASGSTIVAGVRAQGRLKDATLTLFSEPPMAETEILAYLLLGHSTGQATGSDAELLVAAATAIGTSQAYMTAKRLAQSLGFEETRVTPSGLVLGKSLSSRMYITYEIGLLTPTNTLQIRYRLSDHWTIKAESSEAESADLIYTIER